MPESPLSAMSPLRSQETIPTPTPMQIHTAGMDQNAARFSALLHRKEPVQRSFREHAADRTSREGPREAVSNGERKDSASVSARSVARREVRGEGETNENPLQGRQTAPERPPQELDWSPSLWFASATRATEVTEAPATALRTVDELVEAAAAAIKVVQSGDDSAVRLTIKDEVLPGVEIEIWRGGEGLKISVTASNAGSFDLLSERADDLVERLNEKLQQAVTVEIQFEPTTADSRETADQNFDERGPRDERESDQRGDSNRRQRQRQPQEDAEEERR